MYVSMIVAASTNNVIGVDGGLPWHISEDLRRFKALTMGKPMIMGRKTYESIGRALPGRRSIVITRNLEFSAPDCEIVESPQDAIQAAGDTPDVMIIGGGNIYEQMLPLCNRIYLTRVHAEIDGDTFFPQLDENQWKEIERDELPADNERHPACSFITLQRI